MDLYLQAAYPEGVPAEVANRMMPLRGVTGAVPGELLENNVPNSSSSLALRLGQPRYPHMKLVLDPVPGKSPNSCCGQDFLLRVEAHDQHLHAPADSPDAAWLAAIRLSNKELGEKIEAAWAAAGLPTFKEYLRIQLEARKTHMRQGENG